MAAQPLTGEELLSFVESHDFSISVAGYWSAEYSREVLFDPQSLVFTVLDHKEVVLTTSSATAAADAFNAIRPRR